MTVYFLRPIGQRGPVKIGCSDYPMRRLQAFAQWSPAPLEIAALIPGDERLERRFHAKFAHLHSHLEWFREDPLLDATIDAIRAGTFDLAELPAPKRLAYRGGHTPESKAAQSYTRRLRTLERRSDIHVPEEVRLASFTDGDEADVVARKRAIVREFVERMALKERA